MPIRDRLREIREQENSVRKDVRRGSGLIRWYVSRVEDGRAVPAIETLEKMARAMGMPLYQLFCEGEEPPKLAQRTKRKSADEIGWANSGKDDTFLIKFQKLLPRMNKDDRDLLFYVAQKMASPRREAATESSQAAQKRLISLYHRLVDKQIGGTASAKELAAPNGACQRANPDRHAVAESCARRVISAPTKASPAKEISGLQTIFEKRFPLPVRVLSHP
jgi:transcriptional regulator with XRE-family HTH domain